MRRQGITFASRAMVVSVLLFTGVFPVAGATQSWTGSSSPFWADAGNWQSGVAPVPGDNLSFTLGNLSNRSNYNNFPSGTAFGNITIFEGTTVAYVLAGAPIILTNGISTSAAFNSFIPAVFDLDINLNQINQNFSASRGLVFNGNMVMGNTSSYASVFLYIGGGGTITFNGTISGGFNADIIKTNTGTLVLGTGAIFQGGGISVDAGLFRFNGVATNALAICTVGCASYSSPVVQGTGSADQINLYNEVVPGGTLIPGDGGPGILQCKVADLAHGTLVEQINGPAPGTGYAQLVVSSNYSLAVTSIYCSQTPAVPAQLVLVLGYAPALGDSFQIIQGSGSGVFANLAQDSVADSTNGFSFGVSYTNGVTLTTVRRPDSPFVLWSGNASSYYYFLQYLTNVLWSAAQNWAGGVGPTNGSRLQFTRLQARTAAQCPFPPPPQTNDLSVGLSLASLLFSDSNYVIYGNAITVSEGITNHITSGTNACLLGLVTAGPLVFDGDAGGTFVAGGSFNGSGTVRKEGGGRLLYTGTTMNSFVGSVVVDSGEFRADGLFTDGSFAVNGGLLTGTGTVSSVTMNGGTLLPGASPGILHVQGNVTMSAGAVFEVELKGPTPGNGYDQLEVNGAVNLAGATLNVQPGFGIAPDTAFLVLVNDSSNPMAGTFAGLPEGATFQAGGQFFAISYRAGTRSNDVLLTRINPPGSLSGIARVNAGTVQLQGIGTSNVAYTIQANTNLTTTNWVDIGAATGGSAGVFSFNVTNVLSFPQRFFRVQTP
jgi:hypothetical protein